MPQSKAALRVLRSIFSREHRADTDLRSASGKCLFYNSLGTDVKKHDTGEGMLTATL